MRQEAWFGDRQAFRWLIEENQSNWCVITARLADEIAFDVESTVQSRLVYVAPWYARIGKGRRRVKLWDVRGGSSSLELVYFARKHVAKETWIVDSIEPRGERKTTIDSVTESMPFSRNQIRYRRWLLTWTFRRTEWCFFPYYFWLNFTWRKWDDEVKTKRKHTADRCRRRRRRRQRILV